MRSSSDVIAFPSASLTIPHHLWLAGQVLSHILPPPPLHQMFTCSTCLHSKRAAEDEPPYPYLRPLLEFNTQELPNVFSLAFEESEFSVEVGARRQQRVIDILTVIIIDSAQFSVTLITF